MVIVTPPPLNLPDATKLKHLEFRWGGLNIRWVTATLQAVQPGSLQRITVFLRNIQSTPATNTLWEWYEFDRLLMHLWISRSVRPRILCENVPEGFVPRVLPELTRRGFARHP